MSNKYTVDFGVIIMSSMIFIGLGYFFLEEKVFSSMVIRVNPPIVEAKEIIANEIVHEIKLDVSLLNQNDPPRLYNGCEVTSLAMLLNFKGIHVSKNELADAIARVPLQYQNGEFGNPNVGFVGNMEEGPGLGVYHRPIFDLAKHFGDDRVEVADLTNLPFERILEEVGKGNPVWVISTTTLAPLEELQTWQTPQGSVDVTYKMHSVVITGYDRETIYINNPYGVKNQKVARESFISAWEQMGSQAIVVR